MINIKTVLVLGAGASIPYGFPSGALLRKEIIQNFKTQSLSMREMTRYYNNSSLSQKVDDFINTFNNSGTSSIDLFLSRCRNFEAIGKMAIATNIIEHETKSKFLENVNKGDWYSYLYQKLTDKLTYGDQYSEINSNNISIITFNYDRSFEYFFNNSLYYSFSALQKTELKMNYIKFPIHHVYGSIGDITKIPYGLIRDNTYYGIDKYTENLKTIYNERPSISDDLLMLINESNRIIFLGFSYLQENLETLQIDRWRDNLEVYGTALGLLENEINTIKKKFPMDSVYKHFYAVDSLKLLRMVLET